MDDLKYVFFCFSVGVLLKKGGLKIVKKCIEKIFDDLNRWYTCV